MSQCNEPQAHPDRCGCEPEVPVGYVSGERFHAEHERLRECRKERDAARAQLAALEAENARLLALINTPHTDEWFEAVRLEAAHQIERWGTSHDAGKTPADWFWLLGYLGQKAMTAQIAGDDEKARHHTISSGAMLLNWFRAMVGDCDAMRPGIEVKD